MEPIRRIADFRHLEAPPFVRRVAPPKPPCHCASRQQVVLAPMLAKYRSSESTGTTHVLLPSVKGPSRSTIAETSRRLSPENEQGQSIPRAIANDTPASQRSGIHPPVEGLRALSA